jgi:hypothetical protein
MRINVKMVRSLFGLWLCVLGPWLFGCGRSTLQTATVSGKVTLDGQLFGSGTVVFTPEQGRIATGALASDGSFTLSTYGRQDGAIIGRHQVAVVAVQQSSPGPPVEDRAPTWLIPPHYGNPATSGLCFEVKAGVHNTAQFDLTRSARPAAR